MSLCVGSFINVVVYRLPIMLEREMETAQAERFDLFGRIHSVRHAQKIIGVR
ncbi:prepilin peptidase [Serratia ureilytica]